MRLTNGEVEALMAELGLRDLRGFLLGLRQFSFEEAGARLADMQAAIKKAWWGKARELHPDVTGDDPEKTEKFKQLSTVHEWFASIKLRKQEPLPQVFVRTVIFTGTTVSGTCTNNVTSSYTTSGPSPFTR